MHSDSCCNEHEEAANDADLLTAFKAKRDEIGTQALDALGIKDSAVRMICTGLFGHKKD